ncbi:unnamed protein product [Camellia sinensis]
MVLGQMLVTLAFGKLDLEKDSFGERCHHIYQLMHLGSRWIYTWCCFLKNIVQIFTYNPVGELRQHLEIDAHVGGVNDIAFAHSNKQLCIVTCGDDKTIKDAVAGHKQYIFEGHEALVYSVYPSYKENIQFIFSTTIDGKIKAWLYDCLELRVDYDALGLWCTAMAYSADETRANESLNLKEMPIVIVSSKNVPTRIKKCLEEGAQKFMLKPLQQSDVKKKIKEGQQRKALLWVSIYVYEAKLALILILGVTQKFVYEPVHVRDGPNHRTFLNA